MNRIGHIETSQIGTYGSFRRIHIDETGVYQESTGGRERIYWLSPRSNADNAAFDAELRGIPAPSLLLFLLTIVPYLHEVQNPRI